MYLWFNPFKVDFYFEGILDIETLEDTIKAYQTELLKDAIDISEENQWKGIQKGYRGTVWGDSRAARGCG